MAATVRVLSTKSLDSTPTILIVSPDGSKTIVNCGEGCQRIFLEFGQKLSTVNRICLTHLSYESIGGLPGMILTSADIFKVAVPNAKAALSGEKPDPLEPLPGLDVIGPRGTQQFIDSLRHFMRRDAYKVSVHESTYARPTARKSKKRKRAGETSDDYFTIETIVCIQNQNSKSEDSTHTPITAKFEKQLLSFVFKSPPIQGKFLRDRARALGIPPGPLYGKLKSGESVSFTSEDGTVHIVESHEVVEPPSPSIATAVIYYPSMDVLEQLGQSEKLLQLRERGPKDSLLELIVHIAPWELFSSDYCKEWMRSFGPGVQHMYVELGASTNSEALDTGTPFLSASAGAFSRGQLSSQIYGLLPPTSRPHTKIQSLAVDECQDAFTRARPLLEYVIVPRAKKGFQNHAIYKECWTKLKTDADELVRSSAADTLAKEILKSKPVRSVESQGELIFLGTGSALPCKHRNVSGIYLRMENGNSMLLDVGEGTIGQLHRVRNSETCNDLVSEIKAAWISHPHADHHLGIIRLLEERAKFTKDRLTLIAPKNLEDFLLEYANVDPSVSGSYTFINCRDLTPKAAKSDLAERLEKLEVDLGISSCVSIPVAHCPNSFAVILGGTPFGSLAYSGDCRPSMPFAAAALNVDLLIHEATFADGMEAEAKVKRHCTVGEALCVGRKMHAKAVILTHFSQRYPKIPPLSPEAEMGFPVVFAFDYAKVSPHTLMQASMLTPALRLLYPENEKTAGDEGSGATRALEIPGLFAQNSLL